MNRKGQALVEFILILPLFLLILFVIVDFGIILSSKSSLYNESSDIVELIKNGNDINDIPSLYKDLKIDIRKTNDGKYYNVSIGKYVNLITPGLNRILDDPYYISVDRVVPYDEA